MVGQAECGGNTCLEPLQRKGRAPSVGRTGERAQRRPRDREADRPLAAPWQAARSKRRVSALLSDSAVCHPHGLSRLFFLYPAEGGGQRVAVCRSSWVVLCCQTRWSLSWMIQPPDPRAPGTAAAAAAAAFFFGLLVGVQPVRRDRHPCPLRRADLRVVVPVHPQQQRGRNGWQRKRRRRKQRRQREEQQGRRRQRR